MHALHKHAYTVQSLRAKQTLHYISTITATLIASSIDFGDTFGAISLFIGQVSVIVVDSVLGSLPRLWEFGGRTGEKPAQSWVQEEVYIGARDRRFQVMAFLIFLLE